MPNEIPWAWIWLSVSAILNCFLVYALFSSAMKHRKDMHELTVYAQGKLKELTLYKSRRGFG